jgi:F-type H+-transporting ATPase subunit b
MSRRRLFVALLLVAPAALASEETSPHGGIGAFAPLVFSAVNLAIFLWIMARYAFPPVRDWVRDRRDHVVRALEEAARARAEAEELQAQWAARLAQIERTIEEMQSQARLDAERERERILAAARNTAEAIRRDAERAAAYEVRRMQQALRAELVRQATRLAEEATRAQWSAADQQRFVAEFLKQVGP